MEEIKIGDRCRIKDGYVIKDEKGNGVVLAISDREILKQEKQDGR